MSVISIKNWELVTKRIIGRRGYVFKATNVQFAGIDAKSVTLVVNVVEEESQRIYLRKLDAMECGPGAEEKTWDGFALITPVENEQLNEVTKGWTPRTSFPLDFEIQFDLVSEDQLGSVVFGKLPKVIAQTKPPVAACTP